MTDIDCVVVGGGAAGLSAALVLGRARRRTVVVDAGGQSNNAADHIGGLLGHDGRAPSELYGIGRDELASYPSVTVRRGEIVDGRLEGRHVVLLHRDGAEMRTRRVLLATGMQYVPPTLPGLAPLWGRTVFHCPFCHGWEVRDQPLAALASGERALHLALMLRGWSDDVVLLTDGPSDLDAAQQALLADGGVFVDERRIAELAAVDGRLSAVVFVDGDRLPRAGLLVATALRQRSGLAAALGASMAARPMADGAVAVAVDELGRTTVPGVFAAGDTTAVMPQVAAAVAAGSAAAGAIVGSLLADDVGLPFPPHPANDKESTHA